LNWSYLQLPFEVPVVQSWALADASRIVYGPHTVQIGQHQHIVDAVSTVLAVRLYPVPIICETKSEQNPLENETFKGGLRC
jgi:hypothetical protein